MHEWHKSKFKKKIKQKLSELYILAFKIRIPERNGTKKVMFIGKIYYIRTND